MVSNRSYVVGVFCFCEQIVLHEQIAHESEYGIIVPCKSELMELDSSIYGRI